MNIVWLFQEDLKKLQKYSNEKSSHFIIDIIKLIDVDYNCQRLGWTKDSINIKNWLLYYLN